MAVFAGHGVTKLKRFHDRLVLTAEYTPKSCSTSGKTHWNLSYSCVKHPTTKK